MQTSSTLSDAALLASRFINQTNRHIFLTGKAGTGKTTFLRHIIQNTHKKAVIAAPTGIAAINAGGVTLHSLFQLPFGAFIPKHQSEVPHLAEGLFNNITTIASNNKMHASKRQLLREIELLIIDEVSMLRADLLDAIDTVLRVVRRKNNIPFGGVQCLFIGDLLQLPPVIKDQEWYVLKNYYKSVFFFDSVVLSKNKPLYIELDKVYRQADQEFISLLNNLRNNKVTANDIETLNRHYKPGYQIGTRENTITLTTHNYKADSINKDFLDKLNTPLFTYEAVIEDEFSEFSYPVEKTLQLKVGAQVMFIKNDYSGNQRYFNGKIGKVSELDKTNITVEFEDGATIKVDKYEWENKKYALNPVTNEIEETLIGKFIHYPIKLAWAITVHKSQGLTFEKAIVDVGQAFAPGQVYVALSRLKSLDGLILTSRVNYDSIATDISVAEFSSTIQTQVSPDSVLEQDTLDFLRMYLLTSFDFTGLYSSCCEHVSEYNENDKKSGKAKYHKWAQELKGLTSETKTGADKFLRFIEGTLQEKKPDYLQYLTKRVGDAKNFFEPTLKKCASGIMAQIENLKEEKRAKQHAKELQQLEVQYFEQIKKLNKAMGLCNAVLFGQEFSKKESEAVVDLKERSEELKAALPSSARKEPATKKKTSSRSQSGSVTRTSAKSTPKDKKVNTKEASFKLFKAGKSIEEIARIQNLAVGTIEGHLAHYVKIKLLDVYDFVKIGKVKDILAVQKELQTTQLTPIKQLLGDEYSYSDIRFVMATLEGE
jgi:hypothetical protein